MSNCAHDSMPEKQVFISYSHTDKKWRDDLDTHLKPYLRGGLIVSWSDQQIAPGSEWFKEIQTALANSKVAVLLVSAEFLASDFIHEHELGPLLKEAKQGGVRILWVPVRDSAYKQTALKDYQAALSPDTPLAAMTKANRDSAWVRICEAIKKAIDISDDSNDATSQSVAPLGNQSEAARSQKGSTTSKAAKTKPPPRQAWLGRNAQIAAAAGFGVVFLLLILSIAVFIPEPTQFQYQVFRITLALAAAGVGAMIPGILDVQISSVIRAGGAMAIFLVVYFYSPAQLAVREIHLDPPSPSYPYDGTIFNTYPRTTTLRWSPLKNATHYLVEVQWQNPMDGLWHILPNYPVAVEETSYTFDFVGAQTGRWRVAAVDLKNQKTQYSDYWYFKYQK